MHDVQLYNNQYLNQDVEFYNVLHVDLVVHHYHEQIKNMDLKRNYLKFNSNIKKTNREHFLNFEQEMFHGDLLDLIKDVQLLFEQHFYETI